MSLSKETIPGPFSMLMGLIDTDPYVSRYSVQV